MNKSILLSFVLGAVVVSAIIWLLRPYLEARSTSATPASGASTVSLPPMKSASIGTTAPPTTSQQPPLADSIDVLAERLKARLEKTPNDMNGWVLLARSYHYLQRWDEAQAAFAKARSLGYQGEPEPLSATESMSSTSVAMPNDSAAPDPVFEEVGRVVQRKSAQLQAGQSQ